MKFKRLCFFGIFLLLSFHNSLAQLSERYPIQLSQFVPAMPILNPAFSGLNSKVEFFGGQQRYFGPFNNINSVFASFTFNPENISLKKSSFGLIFSNDQEGGLLNYSKGYVTYSIKIPLTPEWKVSAGFNVGFVNFSADQTSTSIRVSSYAMDGSVGLMVYKENFQFGISGNQVFNGELTSIQERIFLKRYATFFVLKKIVVSPDFDILPACLIKIKPSAVNADFNLNALLDKHFLVGMSYRFNQGIAFMAGLNKVKLLSGNMQLNLAYNTSYGSGLLTNLTSVELLLSYNF
jgi:type IX secretion system PorP/SprF family membrane protein